MAGMDIHLAGPFTQDKPVDAVDGAAGCGSHLPICNAVSFEEVEAILPPNAILTYLRTLSGRGTTLRDALREQHRMPAAEAEGGLGVAVEARGPFRHPEILVRQVHSLAGSAGMLGFQRLAFVASRFEQALERASPDGPELGESLGALIEESLVEMHRRMRTDGAG